MATKTDIFGNFVCVLRINVKDNNVMLFYIISEKNVHIKANRDKV